MASHELTLTTTGTTAMLHNKHLFIVEDNLENRVVLRIMLARHGARLEFDSWGTNTVNSIRAFMPVDLILMDLMLPRGNSGFLVADHIRTAPDLAQIPIVAVSAADPSVVIPKCREMGFAGFIAKPLDDELFPQQLASMLSGQKVWYAGAGR